MTIHEISPKQLRALLLLLVLVPFIPMVLMLRFMTDALEGERDAAWERLVSTNQRALLSAAASHEKHLATLEAAPPPEELRRFYREVFEPTIEITIADAAGRIVAGPSPADGRHIAQTTIHDRETPWTVRIALIDDRPMKQAVRDQFKVYAWTAMILSVAICAIAAAAGLTVHQQMRLHALKNTAVATVAHELRTPLATMRMLVDTLREGRYRNEQQLSEYLDLLHSENLRLSRLTEHFLTHSRLESGQQAYTFVPVPLRAIIDAALAPLRTRLDAPACTFTLDLAEPLPAVTADRDALVTVLLNLLENALKYTGDEKRITLRARREGEAALIVVEDNGVGLTSAERRQIFEPFYQADRKLSRSRGGAGLGLSIVRGIIGAHRGRIDVTSELGGGTVFAVTLPLAPA
jgi:signal transduction histidine kinase